MKINILKKSFILVGIFLLIEAIFTVTTMSASASPPTAVLYAGRQQNVGYTVCLDGSDSYGGSGNRFTEKDEIVNFIWDFGDGTKKESGEYLNTHTHVYTTPGTYTVTLKVVQLDGQTDSASTTIDVGTLPKKTVSGNTTSAIQSAVNSLNGQPGIVYVPAGSYKYSETVKVPEGVIIEGAGMDGTRIYAVTSNDILFSVSGNNVRFTKLKLQGYSIESSTNQNSQGILMNQRKNIFIDNCETFGFKKSINIMYNSTATVEHCYIHHNTMNSYGYGITVTNESYTMVRYNELSNCRHVIAGAGCSNGTSCPTRYDFIYNYVHGKDDVEQKGCEVDMHTPGHGRMRINYNVFENVSKAIGFRDAFNTQVIGNIFRNVNLNGNSWIQSLGVIYTLAPYMTNGSSHNSPGVDGLYISDNVFENCATHLNLAYGKNIYVNGRKMEIPYKGNITWNDEANPTPQNIAPIADAGSDREISEGIELVELDGSGSDDPDGDVLSYQWTQVSGPAVTLNNPDRIIANFDVPELDEDTEFVFLLRVSDGEFADSDSVTITVQDQLSAPSPSELESKGISAKTTSESIIIDGQLDEWPGANSVSFTDDSGRGTRDNTAKAYALWDDTYLYIAFQVEDTELAATETAGDGKVWRDDAIELFLDTQNNESSAPDADDYQFIVNLNGAVYDSKQGDSTWNSALQSAVKLAGTLNDSENDAGYTIELAIPWSDVGSKPEVGAMMGIDFAVEDEDSGDGYQYFDWADISPFAQPDKWAKITYLEDQTPTPDNRAPMADAGLDREIPEGVVTPNNPDEIIANFDAPGIDEIDSNPVTPTVPSDAVVPIPTPEPGTLLLLGVGLIGVIALRRRAHKRLSENN